MKLFKHIIVVLLGLLVCLGLPGLVFADLGTMVSGSVDAVSHASLDLPDQPSGAYVVIVNRDKHPLTTQEWTSFFREEQVGVIMEDISCLAAAADPTGLQLARRYQARLAENQMELTAENSLLIVSRAENGLYDVIVLSKELADAVDFSGVYARQDAEVIMIGGAES